MTPHAAGCRKNFHLHKETGSVNLKLFFFLIMFCGGMALATQPSINASLAKKTGLLESACISFSVGTLILYFLAFSLGRTAFGGILKAAPWELSGGLLGAFYVTLTILVVPKIGTTATMAAVIAAQLSFGMLLDYLGAFGLTPVPVDLKRLAGAVLLFLGAVLIFKR